MLPLIRSAGIRVFVESCLPWVVWWAWRTERASLRAGRVLTAAESACAAALGVRFPDKVRVCTVPAVPLPGPRWLQRIAAGAGFDASHTAGLCLRYAIFLHAGAGPAAAAGILKHELVHTTQYERLGGLYPFLRRYLTECIRDGYPESALEREAIERGR